MDLIIDVLKELQFSIKDVFCVEYDFSNNKAQRIEVVFLVSNENDSQAFLVVGCDNDQLKEFAKGTFVEKIASEFRKNTFHKAEMDRNTSLIVACKYKEDDIDDTSKVIIEDDPYYFKKYVFSYTDKDMNKANKWLQNKKGNRTTISAIQDYITNVRYYNSYVESSFSKPIYKVFSELVTKLHCFPMKVSETKRVKSVDSYLKQTLKSSKKSPSKPEISLKAIEKFLQLDINYEDADDVCMKWDLATKKGNGKTQ